LAMVIRRYRIKAWIPSMDPNVSLRLPNCSATDTIAAINSHPLVSGYTEERRMCGHKR